MAPPFHVLVSEKGQILYEEDLTGAVELGRQQEKEEKLFSLHILDPERARLPIAQLSEQDVSREHALVEPLGDGRVRLTNLSSLRPIKVVGRRDLTPKAPPCELALPVSFTLGNKSVRLEPAAGKEPPIQTLAELTRAPGEESALLRAARLVPSGALDMKDVISWLQAALDVLQSAASSSDFFQKAAQAAVELVELDSAQVLLLEGGAWKPAARHTAARAAGGSSLRPSQHVLARVLEEKRTFWQNPGASAAASLVGVQAVVAAPILDRQRRVIGVLYGDRQVQPQAGGSSAVSTLDAMLVELLAGGVAAGLARLEQEKSALAAHVRFEQFFTPELARQLANQPDLLQGRDEEVTLLFCDVRGFSRLSERLGPARTVEWISNVMEVLSDCVLAQEGVLVDYIGDELIAMWGAPEKQPDHARRACAAALAMLAELPRLNERWQPALGGPMDFGIGINSGVARVGNTGSRRKFKYGPLGNTANLASRVQGATKYLKAKLLVTGATRAQLGDEYPARRIGKVRVVNIAEPVELYELAPPDRPDWAVLRREYEVALEAFEREEFGSVARVLGNLMLSFPGDGPSLLLLSRAVTCLVEEPAAFDAVWELPGK
jgi:adenylate cyclase